MSKKVIIKVFRPTGEFLKIWNNAKFERFTKELNSGLGPCLIDLGEEFNYSGGDLKLNNEVQIFIDDTDTIGTPEGNRLMYSGYISNYVPWIDGHKEGITVNLLGYYTKFAQDIYKNGNIVVIREPDPLSGGAVDIGTMFRNLMVRYKAETANSKMDYLNETITTTSTTGKYIFNMLTYRKAIDAIKSMAPANWWWYVDELNLVYFKSKPSITTHEFILSNHFTEVRVERSMEKIKNAFLHWVTTAVEDNLRYYRNDLSIADYGRRMVVVRDDFVYNNPTSTAIAEGFITEHKDPDIKVVVTVIDNNEDQNFGYDIDSIQPGDTCNLRGFDDSLADIFEENMLITKVEYNLKFARVTIEPMRAGLILRQEEIAKRLENLANREIPETYLTA